MQCSMRAIVADPDGESLDEMFEFAKR